MVNIEDLNLIPCLDRSKKPSISWKEYQTKKYDKDITCTNKAVILGQTSEGVVVIDIDAPGLENRIFGDFEKIKNKTLVVRTGRGGTHIYVKPILPVQTKRLDNDKGEHIDIQAEGTYVMAPGSIHENGKTYEIISNTTDISEMDLAGFIKGLAIFGFKVEGTSLPPIESIVKGMKSGGRNNACFKLSAYLLGTLHFDKEVALDEVKRWNSKNTPPLSDQELETTFNSALKRVVVDRLPVKKVVEEKEEEESFNRNIDAISAQDERLLINFDALVVGMDEHKTVTVKSTVCCDKDDITQDVIGTGFDNPEMPKCEKCGVRMVEEPQSRETIDVRDLLIEELPECVKEQPIRFHAKVKGELVHTVKVNCRYRFKARFTSMTNPSNKRENLIVLQVFKMATLEEPEGQVLTPEETTKIKDLINIYGLQPVYTSIAPKLEGLLGAKETLLIALVGAPRFGDRRGDINVIFVGNQSRGKSELLKFGARISPKSSYVNGKSSSGVGLTYSMVKLPNGTSVPRAGKMVLNDGGNICLDETDKMTPQSRGDLLECMEQQTVTMNKSGSTGIPVNARTAVIAAANPRNGIYDDSMSVKDNLNLEEPFISRFDRIWNLAKMTQLEQQKMARHVVYSTAGKYDVSLTETELKHYLNTVKKIIPTLTPEAQKRIEAWYLRMCELLDNSKEKIPMEPRQLEGMIRACLARARCYLSETVTQKMVEEEIDLFNRGLETLNIKIGETSIQTTFMEEEVTREMAVIKAWRACEDEEQCVKKDEFDKYLIEHYSNYYPDAFSVDKLWRTHEGVKFQRQKNLKYKLFLG